MPLMDFFAMFIFAERSAAKARHFRR